MRFRPGLLILEKTAGLSTKGGAGNEENFLRLLALLAMPAGAAERDTAFSDQAEIRNGYAVQMLVELELIGGYKDGSFQPGAPITRAETAKLIAFFCTDTPEPASWVSFADTNDSWAKDYIAYCAGEGIVGGSGGLFRPKDNVTAQELAKMLLAAVGFDASRYTGAGWAARVNADAEENGVYHSFTGQYDEPVTRDDACLLIYNAMQCPATDGTARYVLDELMNPKTYLEERFDAVRYTAVLTGNECADLTQTDAALKKGVTKLEGHKEFAVSTGLGLVGHRVDIYLRNGHLLGTPAESVTERSLTVMDAGRLEARCAEAGLTLDAATQYYLDYNAADAGVLSELPYGAVVTVIDYDGDGVIDAVLVLRCADGTVTEAEPLSVRSSIGNGWAKAFSDSAALTAGEDVRCADICGVTYVLPLQ